MVIWVEINKSVWFKNYKWRRWLVTRENNKKAVELVEKISNDTNS